MDPAFEEIPFDYLTKEDANEIVRQIKRGAKSDENLRDLLTNAGFDGKAAAVTSISLGPWYWPLVMVWGPTDEIITG